MGESTRGGRIPESLVRRQDKAASQAFHSEADNIPLAFPGKWPGLEGLARLAGDTEQEKAGEGGRVKEAVFVFSTNAKECRCDGGRVLTDEEGLQTCCWFVCLLTLGPTLTSMAITIEVQKKKKKMVIIWIHFPQLSVTCQGSSEMYSVPSWN